MIPWAHSSPQPKWHLDRFSHFRTGDRRVSLYFTMGRSFPPQNCPFPWGIWTPSSTWFLGLTRVLNPNGISIGAAVFAGLTSVTDRPTDHATRSVTTAASTYVVLRCGLKKNSNFSLGEKSVLNSTRTTHKVIQLKYVNLSAEGKALGLHGEWDSLLKRLIPSSLFQTITSAVALRFFAYSDYTNNNNCGHISAHDKNKADHYCKYMPTVLSISIKETT